MFFSLLSPFYHSIIFQCIYVIIIISNKHFVYIKTLCKISFIVLTMAWARKLLQIYKYLLINLIYYHKLLIHNINLTGHRRSAFCLQLLVFLEIWVSGSFWHWRSQVFPKGYCHHDLKTFCETGYNSVLLNTIKNMK